MGVDLAALEQPATQPEQNRAQRRVIAALEHAPQAPRASSARRRSDRAARLERAQRRGERHLARVRERLVERGIVIERPAVIPVAVWSMASDVLADPSGRAARIWLARYAKRFPHAVGAVRMAALVPLEQGGAVYLWSDERTRRIVALGLSLLSLATSTRRKGRYRHLVCGVARGAFRALLRNPFSGEQPSMSAIAGVHRRGASLQSGQLGYLRALESAGFCYRQQVYAQRESCEIGFPSGHPPNRYWLLARPIHDVRAAELAVLNGLERLAWTIDGAGPLEPRASRAARQAALAALAAPSPAPS